MDELTMRVKRLWKNTQKFRQKWVLRFEKSYSKALWVLIAFIFVSISGVLGYQSSAAQSLNEAVTRQLEREPATGKDCGLLLGLSPPSPTLAPPLNTICNRGGGAGGTPSTSTGGGAATPTTLPSIVQRRLREVRGEEKQAETKPKPTGASADAFVRLGSGLNLFISGEYESLNRDVTTFEDGYDSDIFGVTVGLDYQFTDRILAGIAFNYYQQDGDFDGGGNFDVNSYGILAYGAFLPTDRAFVQFYGGFARNSFDRDRLATFTELASNTAVRSFANADYDADYHSAGILVGYDYPIDNVSIAPRAGFDWSHTDFDTYSEKGNSGLELNFHGDDQTWLQSRIGLQASVVFKTGFGTLVPQASFDWKHEFENDQRNVKASFINDTRGKKFRYQTEKPDRDWGEINAGVAVVLSNGLQILGNYRTLVGHKIFESHGATIGLRVPFPH